jgi:hypothetical protein
MLISQWLVQFSRRQGMLDNLISRVAARCEPVVWARVFPTAATMDLAQARGYIRARAALVITREIQIATASLPPVSAAMCDEIRRAVTQRLVHHTLTEISLRRPMSAVPRRAAA